MNLTPEQICSVAQGALRTETIDGAVIFHRFTPKQEQLYTTVSNDSFFKKAFATAGVRLEFTTDAEKFTLDYTAKSASSRDYYAIDVLVDGTMVKHFGHERVHEVTSQFSVSLPKGTHTVRIYLPALKATQINALELDGGDTFAPVKRPLRLFAFGDSITQGYDAAYPSQSYVNLLADKLGAEVTNFGIGGEFFRPALITDDLCEQPDLITVAYGTNDWSKHTAEELKAASAGFFANLRAAFPKVKIFAITPLWRAESVNNTQCGSFESARELVRAAARAQDAVIIEGDPLVPHVPECFYDKRLHPNDLGFKFYANALYQAMLPHLAKE